MGLISICKIQDFFYQFIEPELRWILQKSTFALFLLHIVYMDFFILLFRKKLLWLPHCLRVI